MGQAIPRQHPAVVLRSRFNQLRALLAVALLAVAGLTVAVVILANDGDEVGGTSAARPIESINYGDFNPATGRPESPGTRYDGGPEEGTADVAPTQPRVTQDRAFPGLAGETAGDYAHRPLPPAAPAKDYSKNAATGDSGVVPAQPTGSRSDGDPDEGAHLSGPRP